ncbi:MAG: hypothetical protein M1831_001710 [Alyxoria varia]|nr:MAG: hypothetical protein M1831_001710 [Alyxoria varia]
MKGFTSAVVAALSANAMAAPQGKPPGTAAGITDADILNYALTLEHLENTFYRTGLDKFSKEDFAAAGYDETFYGNLKEVSMDESTHVDFLTKALGKAGAEAVKPCEYDFSAAKDVDSFLMTASVLEGVGVSAYLGAAASIMEKMYLTAAGSILTVESRHSAYIRSSLDQSPFPSAFDVPLTFNEVYTLAAPFIKACPPSNPELPVKAFPTLTLDMASAPMPIQTGSKVTLVGEEGCSGEVFAAFITVTGPVFADVHEAAPKNYEVTIPEGISGQSYVVLTKNKEEVTDDTVKAGPAIVEVTPAYKLKKDY